MLQLVFDRAAIKHNIAAVKKRAGKSIIYAILTADGYGAGLLELATLLRDDGISHFAVTDVSDARKLRKGGFVEEEILMLRSTTDETELSELLDLNVVCTIGSYEAGIALNGIAEGRATIVEAHIQVDTGMGFGGFVASEPEKILSMYRYLPNVALSGIYTQIHTLNRSKKTVQTQMDVFSGVLNLIHEAGFETGITHAAGSYALLNYKLPELDAVRVGSALLGRGRGAGRRLTKVGYGRVELEDVRWLPAGHTVGNEKLVKLKRATKVAVIPVGYQNGFGAESERVGGLWPNLRRWWRSRHMTVLLRSQRVQVIGRVGAIETLVDVTNIPCAPGDTVIFDIDPLLARGMKKEYR